LRNTLNIAERVFFQFDRHETLHPGRSEDLTMIYINIQYDFGRMMIVSRPPPSNSRPDINVNKIIACLPKV